MKICAIVHDTVWKNPPENSLKIERAISEALALYPDTQTVLFPELSFTGFVMDGDNERLAETREGFCVLETQRLAQKFNVNLICGFIEKNPGGKPYNAVCVADRNGVLKAVYRKNHLYTASDEPQLYGRGENLALCDLDGWRCGFFICFDVRFPRLFEAYKKAGAECLFGAFNWLEGRNKPELFEMLTKTRAHENRLFVVSVDRGGRDPNTGYTETCCVANPYGESCIASSKHPYYAAELKKEDIAAVEKAMPLAESFRSAYSVQDI